MKRLWIYTAIMFATSHTGMGEKMGMLSMEEGNLSSQETQRLKQQLDDLYALAEAQIQKNHIELRYSNAAEIMQNLIETNATSLSTSYTKCPTTLGAQGIYTIQVPGLEPFPVYCDAMLAGPGWIVVARRTNDRQNFFLNWQQYKRGFGNLEDDFFIGLNKLHAITKSQAHELYIHLEDFEGETRYAHYDEFFIESENLFYAMTKLGTFTGDAGDSMRPNLKQNFSTYDKDNDQWDRNCAVAYTGAWWHVNCTYSNLFGLYLGGKNEEILNWKGMMWHRWRGEEYSYKTMLMMVRPKCTNSN